MNAGSIAHKCIVGSDWLITNISCPFIYLVSIWIWSKMMYSHPVIIAKQLFNLSDNAQEWIYVCRRRIMSFAKNIFNKIIAWLEMTFVCVVEIMPILSVLNISYHDIKKYIYIKRRQICLIVLILWLYVHCWTLLMKNVLPKRPTVEETHIRCKII